MKDDNAVQEGFPEVVIDGAAGVGKTTVSKALADRLGYSYISTGYIYRAVALKISQNNIDVDDIKAVADVAKEIKLYFKQKDNITRIFMDGSDITDLISAPTIVPLTAKISVIPDVRKNLLMVQRKLAKKERMIFDGRDMGTVVFPNAKWKFYITASFELRLTRLLKVMDPEEKKKYPNPESYKPVLEQIDRHEKNSPAYMSLPKDTIIYDNTYSPTPEQDAIVLEYYMTHADEIMSNAKILKRYKK